MTHQPFSSNDAWAATKHGTPRSMIRAFKNDNGSGYITPAPGKLERRQDGSREAGVERLHKGQSTYCFVISRINQMNG